ncbi:MAG: phosphoribosylanthranilate isomerase [candidate division Zixibacteria bacterium]|nr:phosphoribosylanthranilate isomerase [candidate division Zixibacteria bacterium]
MKRTLVKICGITRGEDALAAEQADCDAIGLVFWPGSKRCVDIARARLIRSQLSAAVVVVGVFVEPDVEMVRRHISELNLDAVQLCGQLAEGAWDELSTSVRLIRAIGVGNREIDPAERLAFVSDYMLDNGGQGSYGGTGQPFDWRLGNGVREWGHLWLAGGLTSANVGEAIRRLSPYAVDVSTGVESRPGVKSPELIGAFVQAVREADAMGPGQ